MIRTALASSALLILGVASGGRPAAAQVPDAATFLAEIGFSKDQYLLEYPRSKPPSAEEAYRWSHYMGQGTPTIALTHSLYIPESPRLARAARLGYPTRLASLARR